MTLQTLQLLFKDITERHKGDVRFFTGLQSDFDPANEANYPALHVDPISVSTTLTDQYVVNWSIVMELVDKLPDDRTTEDVNEALNRLNEVRKAVMFELMNFGRGDKEFNGVELDFTIPAIILDTPIIDETENNLTGWQTTFTIVEPIAGSTVQCCLDDNFN